jgi:uncharacterized cupredoxin-like copper-binding protein
LTVPALGACVFVGLLAAFGAVSALAAFKSSAAAKPTAAGKVTLINVSLGKPTELGITLSKFSMIPTGTVTFKVTNPGAGWHNFQVCAKPVATPASAKNACVGKKTAILKHGQSALLTVALSKSGVYEFLCSVTGHAAAGMKGVFGVAVKVTAADMRTASKAGSSTSTGGGGGGTTTTTGGGGGGGGGGGEEVGPAVGCPPGVTVRGSGNQDGDGDEAGTERDDQDGCV